MAGCPATGTSEWLTLLREAWHEACVAFKVDIAPPPEDWLHLHHLSLLAALIRSLRWTTPTTPARTLQPAFYLGFIGWVLAM